jgi:cytochrome c
MLIRMRSIVLALVLAVMAAAAATATPPTKDEVTAVVKKAIEFYKANGREKALLELNKKDGLFAKGEDYVDVHDLSGVCVAHPISPAKVGVNRADMTDAAGKFYIKDLLATAKQKQSGWIDYVMKNPTDGKLEAKLAYWEVYDGLIFKAGTYQQ